MATQLDEASPPWCIRLISELNASDRRATALANGLTPQELNWKPSPGEWSVGQCLEHLYVANKVYCPAMLKALAGHPPTVVENITPGWFGRWFIRNYIEPSAEMKKRRAPKKITPGAQVEPSILELFLNSNHTARQLVYRARNCDVNRIRFKNPFVPLIRFSVGTGLEILSRHQNRHLLQAERVKERLEHFERERAF